MYLICHRIVLLKHPDLRHILYSRQLLELDHLPLFATTHACRYKEWSSLISVNLTNGLDSLRGAITDKQTRWHLMSKCGHGALTTNPKSPMQDNSVNKLHSPPPTPQLRRLNYALCWFLFLFSIAGLTNHPIESTWNQQLCYTVHQMAFLAL